MSDLWKIGCMFEIYHVGEKAFSSLLNLIDLNLLPMFFLYPLFNLFFIILSDLPKLSTFPLSISLSLSLYIYIYIYICVCVCVCVWLSSSRSFNHVSLNCKDTFCLYNLIKILSSFLISVSVSGWNWWMDLPKLSWAQFQPESETFIRKPKGS